MNKIKYPRTMNLYFSQSDSSDDVWWKDSAFFEGQDIVMTEKLDGECTTIYQDGSVHARSLDSNHHPSRSWIKQQAASFAHKLPKSYRICGENLFAWHSIFYTDLPTYFFVYGIYDNNNNCVSWDKVEEICDMLDLHTVPVIYRGIWNEKLIQKLWTGKGSFPTFGTTEEYPKYPDDFTPCEAEGYVCRLSQSFPYSDFKKCCAKYVGSGFKLSLRTQHWMSSIPIPNLLKVHE